MCNHTEMVITIRRCVVNPSKPSTTNYVYVATVAFPGGAVGIYAHDNDVSLARLLHNRIIDAAGSIRLS